MSRPPKKHFGYEQTSPLDVRLYTFGLSLSIPEHFFLSP